MIRSFTFWFSLFALLVCILSASGYDRDHMLLYHVSIPVWLIELFRDIHSMPMLAVYAITIAFFAVAGLAIDWLVERSGREQAGP